MLARFPEVTSIVTLTGRSEVATDPVGPDETEVMVKLRPKEEWTTAHDLDDLGEVIKQKVECEVPATFVSVSQPIEDRVNQLLAGSRADVVIKLFGQDLVALKRTADEIGKVVRDVPGRGDWRVQRVLGLPLLEVTPDRQRLARYGMSADRVLEVVEASRVGRSAGKIFEGSRRFDLMLLLPPATLTPEAFGDLLVGSSTGQLVPLASVATIRETEGPAVINRESLQRRVLVEVNVRGRDLVSFVNDARAQVAQRSLPAGVTVEWGGQFENFTRASQRLGLVAPVALAVIFAMLFLMFGDLRFAIAVFVSVPLALVGGVLALSAARAAVLDPGGGRLHRRRGRRRLERRRHGRRAGASLRPVGRRPVDGDSCASSTGEATTTVAVTGSHVCPQGPRRPKSACATVVWRTITRLLVACAAVALLLACLNVNPLGSGISGDDSNDDVPSSLDISIVLPAAQPEPLVVPSISGSVFFNHRPPPSRLTTAEVFRPPRVRG